MKAFHTDHVYPGDFCFYFLLDRNVVINLFVCDKRHDLWAGLYLDNRNLRAAREFWRLFKNLFRKPRILEGHSLLINNQQIYALLVCLYLLFLLCLLFLCAFSENVKNNGNADENRKNNEKYNPASAHVQTSEKRKTAFQIRLRTGSSGDFFILTLFQMRDNETFTHPPQTQGKILL